MPFCGLLCQALSSNRAISITSQISCKVWVPNRLSVVDYSKTMVTYNCKECGSWTNQHLGRTTVSGETTKFQLNFGPPTGITCSHCGGQQMVIPSQYIINNSL